MKERDSEHGTTPRSTKAPKAYHAPTLTAYGSIAKLTQSGAGSFTEGASGMSFDMPTGSGM